MTSPIDDLLARARLLHRPCTQTDIEDAERRIAARATAHSAQDEELEPAWRELLAEPSPRPDEASAEQDLAVLCRTVITHPKALGDLELFFERVPDPAGALVLGCMLQLLDREESARFWWQFAAGAGDPAATYCLSLHHRALGQHGEADWWDCQAAEITVHDADDDEVDVPTVLRIIRALRKDATAVPDTVNAVLHYVPAAVAFVDDDDLELPCPCPIPTSPTA